MYYSLDAFFPQITALHGIMFPLPVALLFGKLFGVRQNMELQTHPSGQAVGYVVVFQMEFVMGKEV